MTINLKSILIVLLYSKSGRNFRESRIQNFLEGLQQSQNISLPLKEILIWEDPQGGKSGD